ncbi:MAG: alpha/beta hydrolase, partial [Bacteroidia bacterium]|nr:alpha/beta hydrolase [Bacteroidia bacterium]
IAPNAISKRDLSKEEFYNWTLQEISDNMGWDCVKIGLVGLLNTAERGNYYFSLYSEEECAAYPEMDKTNIVYFPSDDPAAGEKPFILLIPGGGFVNVWSLTEGWPVALEFNDMGYNVFILTYQVETEAAAVKAMSDVSRALDIIAAHCDEFHVNPESYITCGFSAGGYITCLWNTEKGYRAFNQSKPQACFPIYPVTSYRLMDAEEWDEGEDKDEFARSGLGVGMQEACNSCFEIPSHVEGFPKTAIFVAAEDELVDPEHSKMLARALDDAKIPCRIEIGPTGGHGFGNGKGMCMEGWPERAIKWFEQCE